MEQINKLPYFNKVTAGMALKIAGQNLDYWIKTRIKNGEIIQIKKGMYVTKLYILTINEKQKYYEYLANTIRYPSYLSLEYVMSLSGLIPEGVYSYTSITLKSSRTFVNELGNFSYRNLKNKLFTGFTATELNDYKVSIASKAKALFDFLYLKSFKSSRLMRIELLEGLRINWDEITDIDKEEFKYYVNLSASTKMKKVVKILKW